MEKSRSLIFIIAARGHVRPVSKVTERRPLESKSAAVAGQKPSALARLDLTDLGNRHATAPGCRAKTVRLGRRHGANNLVIVAARKDGFRGRGIGSDSRFGRIRERNSVARR